MLKVLLKKQFIEIFRSYFYNVKTNKKRSTAGIVAMFIFFGVVMIGILGGMFTMLSVAICAGLTAAGMDWLYFSIMTLIAIFMGALGSVFNTYAGLYLGKDNDLLLSMPIPVNSIIAARLLGVYLMGLMYISPVLVPTIVVYFIFSGINVLKIIGCLVLFVCVTFIVLVLSCLLGWVVAKISVKLKNKSFITVIIALACIGVYYFVYFKATTWIENILTNAVIYGEKIKGNAYIVYFLGRTGEGYVPSVLSFVALTLALVGITWLILNKSFTSIATASGAVSKKVYREKTVKTKSVFGTVLAKEFGKFISSPNYMLNCGLGIIFVVAFGVLILIRGAFVFNVVSALLPGAGSALIIGALCMMGSMVDTAAPSVSLEGKNIWILQSLPIEPKIALHAKAAVQFILEAVPMLFAIIAAEIVCPLAVEERIFIAIIPIVFALFNSYFNVFLNVLMPNLSWTSEIYPIKQSMSVFIAIFIGSVYLLIAGLMFFFLMPFIGLTLFYLILTVITLVPAILLILWNNTKGSKRFSEL